MWEKGETTAALLARLLAGREMDDGCAAGWKDGMTATLLSWRESDLLLGGRRAKTVDELVYS